MLFRCRPRGSNGRTIIGSSTQKGLVTEEMTRFPNHIIETGGHFYWDIEITSIGIDTWGVDFVCVGKDESLLYQPYSYRDPHTEGTPEKCFERVPRSRVYELADIQVMNFNSLFQLDTMLRHKDSALEAADKFLFIPDALSYMLTGEMVCEYTVASTAQLVNAGTRRLELELLKSLNLSEENFGRFIYPGDGGYAHRRTATHHGIGSCARHCRCGTRYGIGGSGCSSTEQKLRLPEQRNVVADGSRDRRAHYQR